MKNTATLAAIFALMKISGRRIFNIFIFLVVFWLIFFGNMARITPSIFHSEIISKKNICQKTVDSCVDLLQTGDILLRAGNDLTSEIFRNFNQKNKTFSHCGIVLVENGKPTVYHCIGGEDNPDASMRADEVKNFISAGHNSAFAIVRCPITITQRQQLVHTVLQYYQSKPLFDMNFDLHTDDKLYCAEFVYKAYCKAMHDPKYFPVSTVQGFQYISVDNLFVNAHAKLICQLQY